MNRCTDADRRRRSRRARCSLPALVLALAIAAVAAPASYAQLQLVPFGGGAFSAPYHVAGDPTDPGRVFVAEQAGRIRLVENGVTRATPFLDINTDVLAGNELATGSCECGLFSVAFAPDYAMSGRFYVYYTRNFGPLTNAQPFHDLVIEEFRRSAANPDVADPSTRRVVLVIPHRANSNHNGGQLQFGPDGHLYLATGDGGGGNDPANNAQNLSSLLGKLLRIDPVDPPGAPAYSIPPDNPFAGPASGADEIYAYGLRNPYRFSFDRLTGDLVIGDVGQGAWEEIDFTTVAGASGANFGWDCFEGTVAATSSTEPQCTPMQGAHTGPIHRYPNPAAGGAAINGGYVVRDQTVPSLLGRYLYADTATALGNAIRSAVLAPGGVQGDGATGLTAAGVVSFGEDVCGHVYVAQLNGTVSRVQSAPGTPACSPQLSPTPPGPGPGPGPGSGSGSGPSAPDSAPPGLELELLKGRRAARSREVVIRAGCAEACMVEASTEFLLPGRNFDGGPERVSLAAGLPERLVLPLSRRQARRLRAVLRRGGKAKAIVEAVATDLAANTDRARLRLKQKR